VLDTNSLEDLGYKIIQHDGTTVDSGINRKEKGIVLPEKLAAKSDVDIADMTNPIKTEVETAP